jgi:hypothetical protein
MAEPVRGLDAAIYRNSVVPFLVVVVHIVVARGYTRPFTITHSRYLGNYIHLNPPSSYASPRGVCSAMGETFS